MDIQDVTRNITSVQQSRVENILAMRDVTNANKSNLRLESTLQ
ncbi:hypothetical protein GXM_02083 [Nostoc sphaeroides CCNUC1]|uniref:Flagellin n=3 Tax=Nostoc sphaeroides TaxID=446679 RepID=A0A5P8VW09_9NOSO|nr:hypothetical protein GXM_02083 [Nostoc sphaeroides CCNUC1]